MEYKKVRETDVPHYIYEFEGKYPVIDEKAYAWASATLVGDVEVKEYASIWPNVSMRGDVNKIVVGRYSNIQDNSCLHVADNCFGKCIDLPHLTDSNKQPSQNHPR